MIRTVERGHAAASIARAGVLAGIALLLGATLASAAAPVLKWRYRDRVHKFSVKMYDGYEQVPLSPDADTYHLVAQFRDSKDTGANRGTLNTSVRIYRINKVAKREVTGLEGYDPESLPPELRRRLKEGSQTSTSAWAAAMDYFAPVTKDNRPIPLSDVDTESFEEIESDDKEEIPGKLYTYDLHTLSTQGAELCYLAIAVFAQGNVEYAICMYCGEPLKKKYKKTFERLAESFKWTDEDAEEVQSLDILDGVNISAARRLQIERGLVAGWDAAVSPKKNYVVVYNTKNGKNHDLAQVIAERIEAIREQLYEVQFPPAQPIDAVSIVRVCADRSEYMSYGGPPGSAGYWNSADEELVFYDASPRRKIDDDTLSVLYHEAFHQYIFYSVGDFSPHSWFNEGHGDYYAGARYKKGRFTIEPFTWRLGTVRNAIVEGPRPYKMVLDVDGRETRKWEAKGYTPLKDLVRFSQGEYYSYMGVSYAQGWSLIYFLREIVPKNRKQRAKWGDIVDVYFNTLKAEVSRLRGLSPGGDSGDDSGEEFPGAGDDDEPPEDSDGEGPPGSSPGDDEGPEEPPGEGPGGEDEEAEAPPMIAPFSGARSPASALKNAVDKAFAGVDWEEFEKAWIHGVKREI